MANIKKKLADAGISVGGDIKVYGDFIMTGATKEVHFHDGTHYHGILPQEDAKSTVSGTVPTALPAHLNRDEVILLYRFVTENGFVDSKTSSEEFLYVFGVEQSIPDHFRPVCWLKNKQLLRELLEHVYVRPINSGSIAFSDISNCVPTIFVSKKGVPFTLARRKHEDSLDSDLLANFFK